MSGLDIFFLEVSAYALLEVATETSFRGKKSENLGFLGYFSQVKTEECTSFLHTIFLWLMIAQNEELHGWIQG